MASLWRRTLVYLGLQDDDQYPEYEEYYEEEYYDEADADDWAEPFEDDLERPGARKPQTEPPPPAADRKHAAEQARAAVQYGGKDDSGEDQQQRLRQKDHRQYGQPQPEPDAGPLQLLTNEGIAEFGRSALLEMIPPVITHLLAVSLG